MSSFPYKTRPLLQARIFLDTLGYIHMTNVSKHVHSSPEKSGKITTMSSSLESDSTTGISASTRNPPGPPTSQRCPQYQIPLKLSIAERLLGHGFGNAAHGSRISEREHGVDRGGSEYAGQLQHQGLLEERLQGDEFSELLKFLKKKAGGSERGEGADYVGEKRDEDSESTDISILESVSGGDGRFADAAEQHRVKEHSNLVEEAL